MTTLGEISADCLQRIPKTSEAFHYIDIAAIDRETKRIVSPQILVGAKAPSRARKEVRTGDILVSMTRPNLNAVALVPAALDAQIASTGFDVLRPMTVDPRWLFYLVRTRTFVDSMSKLVQGALYPAVRSKDVRGFAAPIAPLLEQKRIVDKLDALFERVDACRERLDRVPALLKRFRQSILDRVCSGALASDEQIVEGYVPSGWTKQRVESLAVEGGIFDGARDHGSKTPVALNLRTIDYADSGVRVISLENLGHLRFIDSKHTYISEEKYIGLRQNAVGVGDVLVGSFVEDEIRVCAVPQLDTLAIAKADCFCVRPRQGHVMAEYLALQLATTRTHAALSRLVRGATRPRITTKHLRELELPVCSLDEQAGVVETARQYCAAVAAIERVVLRASERTDQLPATLLAKAFRGELVPQDPDDEPASELLSRIRRRLVAPDAGSKIERGGTRPRRTTIKEQTDMLTEKDVMPIHLTKILRERGPLTAEVLWTASRLEIDEFYSQLKDEEVRGLLRENRGDSPTAARLLEAVHEA